MAGSYAAMWPEWTRLAECRGRDTEDWFPEDRHTLKEEIESSMLAKRICSQCPVRAECLEDAFTMHDEFGVRGGATPGQRRMVAADPDRVFLLLSELEVEMAWMDSREEVSA
jgi:WhiB family redox-sensing transcriptional regulator